MRLGKPRVGPRLKRSVGSSVPQTNLLRLEKEVRAPDVIELRRIRRWEGEQSEETTHGQFPVRQACGELCERTKAQRGKVCC